MQISRDERGHAQFGRAEIFIQALIVLSLLSFALETVKTLPPAVRIGLEIFEGFCIAVFTVEYLLRLKLSTSARAYAFSFYGFIDLLAIVPYYVAAGLDLRSVRAFQLLRLIRILKLGRYSIAVQRFHRAFVLVKEELVLFGFVASCILYLSAVGIYYFENEAQPDKFGSIFDSLWWAIATLTTVGYGDVYPITVAGRAFTFLVLLSCLGIVAVPTGVIASALAKAREQEETKGRRRSDRGGSIAMPDEVHRFWFADATADPQAAEARDKVWYGTSPDFDAQIRERFEPTIAVAGRGELSSWETTPRSCVALVVALDQFPRNAYRNTAAAFAHDARALEAARHGVAAGYLDALSIPEQAFLLMPYQHAEDAATQREGVLWFERLHAKAPVEWHAFTANCLGFQRRHLEIIERFGRFPHRNAILGRKSTAEEREYLASKPETFGQGG
jgi:voltage-gated potassium channel